jgi:hypothetical protein
MTAPKGVSEAESGCVLIICNKYNRRNRIYVMAWNVFQFLFQPPLSIAIETERLCQRIASLSQSEEKSALTQRSYM